MKFICLKPIAWKVFQSKKLREIKGWSFLKFKIENRNDRKSLLRQFIWKKTTYILNI